MKTAMTPWLALQVLWVANHVSDLDYIAAAEKLGHGDMAREQVEIYHTKWGRRH